MRQIEIIQNGRQCLRELVTAFEKQVFCNFKISLLDLLPNIVKFFQAN